jgi:hypothetical protein
MQIVGRPAPGPASRKKARRLGGVPSAPTADGSAGTAASSAAWIAVIFGQRYFVRGIVLTGHK